MSAPQLSKFEQMKASGDLPSPKGVALSVIRLTQRDDSSMAELAQVVRTDPAFVGRLIKAANGCTTGTTRPVASIQEALTILGMPAVRGLALGFSLVSSYRSGNCRNFDYERYWAQSLVRAIALQMIAVRTQCISPDEAFCFGLLSNVGELALATIYPDIYSRLLADNQDTPRSLMLPKEREVFVLDRGSLTAAMLQDWGLPKSFITAIGYIDHPESSVFPDGSRNANILQALLLSFHIGELCLAPEAQRRAMVPQLYLYASRLSFDAVTISQMCDQVAADWHEWGSLLSVSVKSLPPFSSLQQTAAAPEDVLQPGNAVFDVSAPSAVTPGTSINALRVLIVDDEPSMRATLSAILSKAGHEVFVAADGRQAFEMALDLQPQIMVVDWAMPEMSGVELAVALRQTRVGRAVYLILLTGMEDNEHLVEAFESGADDYIVKPLKPRELEARLRAGLRVVALQQEIERDRLDIQRFAAELAVANRRLQELAQTDPLTSLPNRRYAIDRLAQEWAESVRSDRPLSVMVVDIDAFKQINDNHGHDVGDASLQQVATAMKGALRLHDVVCRTGGDEFLVICPNTDIEAAMLCAERIRKAVSKLVLSATSTEIFTPSVSIGVGQRDADMSNPDALIKEADRGVYLAKAKGRNHCVAARST